MSLIIVGSVGSCSPLLTGIIRTADMCHSGHFAEHQKSGNSRKAEKWLVVRSRNQV